MEENNKRKARHLNLSTWLLDHVYVATLIVLIASLVPRLFLIWSADLQELKFPDSPTYFANAISLFDRGEVLDSRQKPEVFRTPGYPVFLLAIMVATGKSLGGEDLRTVLVVQTVITSWSVVLLYWLARRILPPVTAFIGACLAALSPWGAVMAGLPLTEGLFLLNLALLFFVMYLVVEGTEKLSAILLGGGLIGLLTSAAVFVRPIWPLVVLIAIALMVLCGDRRKKAWILVTVMLICAVSPLYLWKDRNQREAQFDGLNLGPGVNAYHYLSSSVKMQLRGTEGDRWALKKAAEEEERQWSQGLTIQELNDERWRRAKVVFQEHPFLTARAFALNAGEALIHPHPDVLKPAGLNFTGDMWVLGGVWVTLLLLAGFGLCCAPDKGRDGGVIQRTWLVTLFGICLLLTLTSGITFGAGSRLRASMELIVPLLAALGLTRLIHMWKQHRRPPTVIAADQHDS